MARTPSGPFVPLGDGSVAVDLDPRYREVLRTLVGELRGLLTSDSPLLRRLFPPPYGDDDERNAGYAALAGPELFERRLAALDVVEASIDAERLDPEQVQAWLTSVNDLRLVLGTLLEVTDDGAEPVVSEDNAGTIGAYEFLGLLLEALVSALME